ncbi:MAG TPA: hypothetical protein VFM59_08060, partial [Salinimicrobium sp.]|nr:hypothetical protein [Salinimicrobium sp.]
MKKEFILLFLFLFFSTKAFCQVQKNPAVSEFLELSPQENVFVHFNSSLLFSGEYLYYKLYAINSDTEEFTEISKIAYVEMIGENGNRVFQHKLKLEEGVAQGDFFIPTSVPSGNYKILGYTQWMKNGGKNHFFQNDLVIINPYRGDQSALRDPEASKADSLSNSNSSGKTVENTIFGYEENENIEVKLVDGSHYATREPVKLSIKASSEDFTTGNYSVSVKRLDSIAIPSRITSENYLQLYKKAEVSKNGESSLVFLPELRGDLIS